MMTDQKTLKRCDSDIPYDQCGKWIVEGLHSPGKRVIVWMGAVATPQEAITKTKEIFGDDYFPLLVRPNYIATGKINPVFVEAKKDTHIT